jgi:hypothetical protein
MRVRRPRVTPLATSAARWPPPMDRGDSQNHQQADGSVVAQALQPFLVVVKFWNRREMIEGSGSATFGQVTSVEPAVEGPSSRPTTSCVPVHELPDGQGDRPRRRCSPRSVRWATTWVRHVRGRRGTALSSRAGAARQTCRRVHAEHDGPTDRVASARGPVPPRGAAPYERLAPSERHRVHGLVGRTVGDASELLTLEDLAAVKEPLAAVVFELPQREIGGMLPSWHDLRAQVAFVRETGAAVHLDGARLWECTPYFGKRVHEIAALFDSVYVRSTRVSAGWPDAAWRATRAWSRRPRVAVSARRDAVCDVALRRGRPGGAARPAAADGSPCRARARGSPAPSMALPVSRCGPTRPRHR